MNGKKMLILLIVTCFTLTEGNADFKYEESCYSGGSTLTLEAVYTGSGIPVTVQWSYSGGTGTNLAVLTSSCTLFGSVPAGYPSASRMAYKCVTTDATLLANTYKLTITGLTSDELTKSWGATFAPPTGTAPAAAQEAIPVCTTTLPTSEVSSTSTTTPSTTTTATPTNTSSTPFPTSVTSTSTPSTTTSATPTNTSSTPFPTSVTSSSTPSTTTSAISTTSISITTTRPTAVATTKPTASPSSGNETTVIIVSSVVGGLFFVGIVITIVLMLLSQRKKHPSVKHSRNHRHHDQDRRQKRLYNQGYPTLQEHRQYNNTSYMEYPGMGTKMNPLYIPNRSAYRAEQNYNLGHPSADHQSYIRNHHLYYNSNIRPQTRMHSYQQRYYGERGGNNMIRSGLPRDENNYVTPDYELYW